MTPRIALLIAAAVMGVAVPVSFSVGDAVDLLRGTTHLERPLKVAIPRSRGGWTTIEDDELREYELEVTKVDDYVSRLYEGPDGERVLLYIAYHGNKQRGLATYYHNATVCYPSAGWELVSERFQDITLHDAAKHVPTCRYTFSRDGEELSVLTFFQVDDELLDQSPRNKPLWLVAEKLTPKFDDSPGTFVQVQVVVAIDGDPMEAAAIQERFLQTFGTAIFQAFP